MSIEKQQQRFVTFNRAVFWLVVCAATIVGWLSFISVASATEVTAVTLTDPLKIIQTKTGETVVYTLAGRVIEFMLGITGSLALLMFVYGGVQWLISAGNQEKIKKGRDTLVWAAIGMIVVLMSYAILTQIINIFAATTTTK